MALLLWRKFSVVWIGRCHRLNRPCRRNLWILCRSIRFTGSNIDPLFSSPLFYLHHANWLNSLCGRMAVWKVMAGHDKVDPVSYFLRGRKTFSFLIIFLSCIVLTLFTQMTTLFYIFINSTEFLLFLYYNKTRNPITH